jgi:hypothetical protein
VIFASTSSHGISRKLLTEENYPKQPDTKRVYGYENIAVSATNGVSLRFTTSTDGAYLAIKIGDPDRTVGVPSATYTVRYTLTRALNHFSDRDELYWNITGSQWASIGSTAISITAPKPLTGVRCVAAPSGGTNPCTLAAIRPNGSALISNAALQNGGVTVAVRIPAGAIQPAPTPDLQPSSGSTLLPPRFTPLTTTILAVETIAAIGAALLLIFGRGKGRDRQRRGGAVDQAFAQSGDTGDDERVPLLTKGETPVEFVPPAQLRPAQLGFLIDEQAKPLQVTATIIDLAARGYLTIAEITKPGATKAIDWQLTSTDKDITSLPDFERYLLIHLFENGSTPALSRLRTHFGANLRSILTMVSGNALERGWFRTDPGKTKGRIIKYGLMGSVGSLFVGWIGFMIGVWPMYFVPIFVASLVAIFGARFAPSRTAAGTATYRRALGFKRFITESEKYRAQFAERANLFTEYLGYAVVFRVTEKWAKTFADLGLEPPDTSFYTGATAFSYDTFASSLSDFGSSSTSYQGLTESSGGSGESAFDDGWDSGSSNDFTSDSGGGGGGGDDW